MDIRKAIRDALGGGVDVNLTDLFNRILEVSVDSGTATGGSNTTCEDTTKNWTAGMWVGAYALLNIGGTEYMRIISANDATSVTFGALPGGVVVAAGDTYAIRVLITSMNLTQISGTAQTGADWTSLLQQLNTLAKLLPIAKAAVFNTALPAAEANWLGADITPTNSPSYLRLHVTVATAGILRVARTIGGVTVTENLNSGNSLTANAAYIFDVEWRSGDSLNFRYSATGANILVFRADEIGGAA